MAKTPKNESSPTASTLAMTTMDTASLAFITNGNPDTVVIPPVKNRKVPFKKVFSSSQLTTSNINNNQQQQQQKSRCSV
ncbi:hypothetical protein BLA29_011655, partial [Euroglyphus maynei]